MKGGLFLFLFFFFFFFLPIFAAFFFTQNIVTHQDAKTLVARMNALAIQ
jgi:hypothetical protein